MNEKTVSPVSKVARDVELKSSYRLSRHSSLAVVLNPALPVYYVGSHFPVTRLSVRYPGYTEERLELTLR